MEMTGLEPVTSCLQSIYSTIELHPQAGVKGFEPLNVDTKNRCLTTWLYSKGGRDLPPKIQGIFYICFQNIYILGNNGLEPLTFSL